jgi:hypothetical protein
MEPTQEVEVTEENLPRSFPDVRSGLGKAKNMKTIFIEPLLVVASSLLWIFVLPLAAAIRAGLAILDRVEALKPREISVALFG